MKGIGTVFRKEVVDNLRDRRTLASALFFGPLFGPLIFGFMISMALERNIKAVEEALELPVIGAEHAPSLIRFLEQQGTVILPEPENPREMVRNQEAQVVLRILPDFGEKWREGLPAPVEVISDPSRQESNAPIRKVKGLLLAYAQQIGSLRLRLRGVSPQLASPIMIGEAS